MRFYFCCFVHGDSLFIPYVVTDFIGAEVQLTFSSLQVNLLRFKNRNVFTSIHVCPK